MNAQDLKNSILQLAMEGKLVEQRKEEGTARELLQAIQEEKARLVAEKKIKKTKPLPPVTEEEKPFDIPESWEWVRLSEIATSTLGKTLNKAKDDGEKEPYLCSINIYWDGISLEKVKTALFDSESKKKYRLQKNDLLICEGGDVGRSAIWNSSSEMYYQNALHCVRFLNNISSQYFLFCMMFYKFSGELKRYCKGVTIQHLVQNSLNSILFPLPPLAEQKRIVAKIEELLPYVEEYDKAQTRLQAFEEKFPEDMKKSILQYAMEGKLVEQRKEEGTARELLQAIQAEKARLVAEKKIKKAKPLPPVTEEEKPFDIPESWEWVRLGEVVSKEIKRGKSPHYTEKSDILVFAQKCNTKAGYIDLSLAKRLEQEYFIKYPEEELMMDKDIVINSTGTGTMGRIGYYQEKDNPLNYPVVPDSHVTIIRSLKNIYSRYVYYVLKVAQPIFEKQGEGSTNQKELRPATIKNHLIPLPPLAEQKRIVAKIEELLPLVEKMRKG